VETVRYYQRRGLITEPARPRGGVRRYTADDADRLRFIKRAQAMGFALAEVENLLKLRTHRSCRATRELAQAKLDIVTARIRDFTRCARNSSFSLLAATQIPKILAAPHGSACKSGESR